MKSLFIISNLMFRGRVKETLPSESYLFAKNFEASSDLISQHHIKEVIIDLGLSSDSLDIIRKLRAAFPQLSIIAFGSHVEVEKLSEASEAGATEVIANSGFVKLLEKRRGL